LKSLKTESLQAMDNTVDRVGLVVEIGDREGYLGIPAIA
jgi:hypothetical protein